MAQAALHARPVGTQNVLGTSRLPVAAVAAKWPSWWGGLWAAALGCTLAGCASVVDAPRLRYHCPYGLVFDARLYQDMALLEGLRGQVTLQRLDDAVASRDGRPDGMTQGDMPGTALSPGMADAPTALAMPDASGAPGATQLSGDSATPRYADATVRASFGLGEDGRLVRLDYTGIPEPVYCQRVPDPYEARNPVTLASARAAAQAAAPVQADKGANPAAASVNETAPGVGAVLNAAVRVDSAAQAAANAHVFGPTGLTVAPPPIVRAWPRPGPRTPPPFDPDAPVQTNIRSSNGLDSAGEGRALPFEP